MTLRQMLKKVKTLLANFKARRIKLRIAQIPIVQVFREVNKFLNLSSGSMVFYRKTVICCALIRVKKLPGELRSGKLLQLRQLSR